MNRYLFNRIKTYIKCQERSKLPIKTLQQHLFSLNLVSQYVGITAKRLISKWAFQEKKARKIFQKTNITYAYAYAYKYVCVSWGKKCSFFGKFGVLCLIKTPVLRLALLPYYRRIVLNFDYAFLG